MNKIYKIVLTGGPCAGKSSTIEILKNHFDDKYEVFIVPEVPIIVRMMGVELVRENPNEKYSLQKSNISAQLAMENVLTTMSKYCNKPVLIILDRSALDPGAYVDEGVYDEILKDLGMTKDEILNRYDIIIHLDTAAKGSPENYSLENGHRSESKEVAVMLDDWTYNASKDHPNIKRIGCYDLFLDKVNEVIELIEKEITHE